MLSQLELMILKQNDEADISTNLARRSATNILHSPLPSFNETVDPDQEIELRMHRHGSGSLDTSAHSEAGVHTMAARDNTASVLAANTFLGSARWCYRPFASIVDMDGHCHCDSHPSIRRSGFGVSRSRLTMGKKSSCGWSLASFLISVHDIHTQL